MLETVEAYRIVCDGCGAWGPTTPHKHLAAAHARIDGWVVSIESDDPNKREWLCPECKERAEEEALDLEQRQTYDRGLGV